MAKSKRYLGPIDDSDSITTKKYVEDNALPTIDEINDGGKILAVTEDGSGIEWVASSGTLVGLVIALS